MKRLYTLALLFITIGAFGQAPQLIPYQAIARDATGQALANTSINARFTIHDETATGAAVWQEIQTVTTTALGLFTAQLGSNVSLGSVDWASGSKFMQVEIDMGSGFVEIGTQQMLSVPYALYASSSGSSIPGPQGAQGPAGPEGNSGPQGIGIASITTSGNNFIITMTDGSTQITPIPNSASTNSGSNANTLIYTTSGF